MEIKNKILIVGGIVIVSIIAFAIVMAFMIKTNSECIQDPFTYAANQVVDSDGAIVNTICTCEMNDVGVQGVFYFDKNGVHREHPLYSNNLYNLSFGLGGDWAE